jgi:hypothetical protein
VIKGLSLLKSLCLLETLPCLLHLPSASSSEFGSLACPDLLGEEALKPGFLHWFVAQNMHKHEKERPD